LPPRRALSLAITAAPFAGKREYAVQVAKALDPTRRLFGDRLISTPDDVPDMNQSQQKSLRRLMPGGADLCLVHASVWPI